MNDGKRIDIAAFLRKFIQVLFKLTAIVTALQEHSSSKAG